MTYITIGKTTYNIDGLEKGARITHEARRDLVYRLIFFNQRISHNHVIQIIVSHLGAMAKKTCERHLEAMLEEKMIYAVKSKNKKLYSTAGVHDAYYYSETMHYHLNAVEKLLPELRENFKNYSSVKQNTVMVNLLKTLAGISTCLWLCEGVKYPDSKMHRKRLSELYAFTVDLGNNVQTASGGPLGKWSFLFAVMNNDAHLSELDLDKYVRMPDREYLQHK